MRVAGPLLLVTLLAGCGVVGPPIPPEDVGLTPLYTKAKQREAQERQEQEARGKTKEPVVGDEPSGVETDTAERDILLPPLRPIGGR
jgi:predicted small lipoprotein YifL